jgi:UPF0716 protein FxsA
VRRVSLVLTLLAIFGVTELVVLWQLGQVIGLGLTLLGLLLSAVIGFRVSKAQGLGVLRAWFATEGDSELHDEGLVDGLLVLTGGLLLVLPGFLGDIIGLALLTPPLRRRLAERIRLRAGGWVQAGQTQVLTTRFVLDPEEERARPDDAAVEIIDVEGVTVEERPERLLGPASPPERP